MWIYISGDFKLSDHSEIKFVNKNELLDYDLAPADIPLAEYIVKNCSTPCGSKAELCCVFIYWQLCD